VLEGELEHRDSMGNVGIVRPGGVQYLSAGTGLRHAELNHSSEHPVHFVQMWVMPRERDLEPKYGQVDFTTADRDNRWLTVASGEPGVTAPISIFQDATLSVARLDTTSLKKTIAAGRYAFLFVAAGTLVFGDQALSAGDSVRIQGPFEIDIAGSGEAVLWDLPPLPGKALV
jgi:redox-sensitive bicupin YhaK (pirin superfamily)